MKERIHPTTVHTKVGWVLSGRAGHQEVTTNLTMASAHTLKINAYPAEPSLDNRLKQFWDLESLGIMKDESSVYERLVQQIEFDGHRCEVKLHWKEDHSPLLDHFDLCRKRLGLLKRLKQKSKGPF